MELIASGVPIVETEAHASLGGHRSSGTGVNGETDCGNEGAGSGNGVGSSDSGNANTGSLSVQGETEEGNEDSGILSPDSNFILEKELEAWLKAHESA
ncbi:hypothetical protein GALMADRAFT_259919 [Galerina marginata CBS 339.88]|uniref:Uncharacterized protein n=1 Tax=Galerina marginata (strain CBS 339.88) TaxID=685588 RepID=A0A067S7U6_GALM3|nr:hypothetical protein GALMADRAFT_259919 [Galerina marginata CBS 339.88]